MSTSLNLTEILSSLQDYMTADGSISTEQRSFYTSFRTQLDAHPGTFLLRDIQGLMEAAREEMFEEVSDEEFEAYLLEVLSEFQITIPELGTITATTRPLVILTANGTRDLSDALRRRCIYAHIDYPDRQTELAILASRCPDIESHLGQQIVGFVQKLRHEELEKVPGMAEMLDFAAALAGLGIKDLASDPAVLQAALATLLKTQADRAMVPIEVAARLAGKAA